MPDRPPTSPPPPPPGAPSPPGPPASAPSGAELGARVVALDGSLRASLAAVKTLESASQQFAHSVHEAFPEWATLTRLYVALPFYRLPARERAFAEALALAKGVSLARAQETSVLTLLGTRGELPQWCDRRRSQGHVAIPLLDARFVESVPMVASLLRSLGVDLNWFDVPRDVFIRKLVGGFNGLFHVADARDAVDAQGRLIIPAQDFVQAHGVRTVFGVGGAYLNGWMATLICFTRERLSPEEASTFVRLATTFKLATMHLVAQGALFEPA